MGVNNSWRTQQNMNDWMRNIEKRLMHEERRPQVAPAYDVVGPGISTYSQQTEDWDSDGPIVNGFFNSVADQVVNSPDDTLNWMGIVQSNPAGQGLQRVWQYIDNADDPEPEADPALYTRAFVTNEDGTRTYTAWISGGGGGGGAPSGPAGGDLTGIYPNPTIDPTVKAALMVDVAEEGVGVVDDATRINFTGPGVTVTSEGTGLAGVHIGGGSGSGFPADVDTWESLSTQALPNSAFNDVEDWSQVGANPGYVTYSLGVWTVVKTDTYLLTATVEFGAGTSARRVLAIRVNGAEQQRVDQTTANVAVSQVSWAQELTAGDVFTVVVWTNVSGVSLSGSAPPHTMQITPLASIGPAGPTGPTGPPIPVYTGSLPALTAGVWTLVSHSLGKAVVSATFYESGTEIELDYRIASTNTIEVRSDLAVGSGVYTTMVWG